MRFNFYKLLFVTCFINLSFSLNAQIISTVAGNGTTGHSGDGFAATAATLQIPAGVVADAAGNIYFADATYNVIRKINSAGIIRTVAGNGITGFSGDGFAATLASLNNPQGIAVDATGNIYIADNGNNRVRKVNTAGNISTVAGNGLAGLSGDGSTATLAQIRASGVFVDSVGNLFIADGNSNIRKVNNTGIITTIAGNGTAGVGADGVPATTTMLNNPTAVTMDRSGNIYIVDNLNNKIRKVNTSGIISTIAGDGTAGNIGNGGPATSAEFNFSYLGSAALCGLAIDTWGNLFITDKYNNQIRKMDVFGNINFYAGNGDTTYTGDGGPAAAASIKKPMAVALDPSRNLYVSDLNHVIRKVTSPAPISIISEMGDTVCTGTAIYFDAFATIGSSTIAYQWKKNGISVGTNNSIYTADSVSTGDVIVCYLYDTVGGTIIATSNTLTMYAMSLVLPTVSIISYYGDSICLGTPDTFAASNTYGGFLPGYKWYVNGAHIFNGNPFYYSPINGDSIYCLLYSSVSCILSSPVTSNTIHIHTVSHLTTSLSITATTGSTICSGTVAHFVATTTNGGHSPTFQWKVNGVISGSDSSEFSYYPSTGDVVSCIFTSSNSCATPSTITSNSIIVTVISSVTPTISISTIGTDTVCAGTSVSFTSSISNGGTSPIYDWKKNDTLVYTGSLFSCTPVNGDVIKCILYSNATCAVPDSAISNSITLVVNPNVVPIVSISASADSVCNGTSVTFTATGSNTGSSPVYQWFKNGSLTSTGSSFSYSPTNGDHIKCILHSNANCRAFDTAVSSILTITVLPLITPYINITSSLPDTICSGTVLNLFSSITGAGSTPIYNWKINNVHVSSSSSYSFIPTTIDTLINCELTGNAMCATVDSVLSNTIHIHVDSALHPTISITPHGLDTLCAGSSVTVVQSSTGIGSYPSFKWYKNGTIVSTSSSPYIFTPATGDLIYCFLATNACSSDTAKSDSVIFNVSPLLTPSVTITRSADSVCSGTNVTFTTTGINTGSAPVYLWYKNGIQVSIGISYTYAPVNGDSIKCILVSNLRCVTTDTVISNYFIMHVIPTVVPTISITASADTVCAGTTVLFSSTTTYGGSSASLLWKRNGLNITFGTTCSLTPSNGDVIKCVFTSSALCASPSTITSDSIVMTVNPVVIPTISISVSTADTVCSGTSVTFTATTTHSGSTPHYQWYKNGTALTGSTSTAYTYTPTSGDYLYCILISNAICAMPDTVLSNTITMFVIPTVIPSVSILSLPGDTVCSGTSVTITASPVNGGLSPNYQWKKNSVIISDTTGTYSYTPTTGDIITCRLNSNATCAVPDTALSSVLTMVVNPIIVPSVSISVSPNDTVCTGTLVTFTATSVNGGTSPVYQWKKNGINVGTGMSTYSYTPTTGDIITCRLTSSAACAVPDTAMSAGITMIVNAYFSPAVTISSSTSDTVCSGTSVTFSASPVHGGSLPFYEWFKNGSSAGTGVTYTYAPVNGDVIKCRLTSNYPCLIIDTVTSITITMVVTPSFLPVITISKSADSICAGTSVTYNAIDTNGGTAPIFIWKVNSSVVGTSSTSYSYIPNNTDIITCEMISNMHCAMPDSVNSNSISMTIYPNLTSSVNIVVSPATTVTAGTLLTFTASGTNGGTAATYQWYINGLPVPGATSSVFSSDTLSNHDNIYCIMTTSLVCTTPLLNVSNSIVITVTVGIKQISNSENQISLLPNPNNGSFNLIGKINPDEENCEIEITNMLGQILYTQKLVTPNGIIDKQIVINNKIKSEFYQLKMITKNSTYLIGFIVD